METGIPRSGYPFAILRESWDRPAQFYLTGLLQSKIEGFKVVFIYMYKFYLPVTVTLDTVPLIALRTLTLAVSHILVDLLAMLAPGLWTSRWNVPAVTLDTRAVFLIFF